MLLTFITWFLIVSGGNADSPLRMKIEASLRRAFGDSISITSPRLRVPIDIREKVFALSQQYLGADTITIYTCSHNGKDIGFGMVDDVKGKSRMITYMVILNPDETVADVDILVYRESIGGEISNESFRKQFLLKMYSDDLRLGSGIRNISGATISARAIIHGVRKLLTAFHLLKDQIPK